MKNIFKNISVSEPLNDTLEDIDEGHEDTESDDSEPVLVIIPEDSQLDEIESVDSENDADIPPVISPVTVIKSTDIPENELAKTTAEAFPKIIAKTAENVHILEEKISDKPAEVFPEIETKPTEDEVVTVCGLPGNISIADKGKGCFGSN